MPTYAHGACFGYIWNINTTCIRKGSRNEHVKSSIHLRLLLPYFYNSNVIKKNGLECRQEGEGMGIFIFTKIPSWIFTYFHRFTSIKVGPTYLLHTLDNNIVRSYGIHLALLILHSSMKILKIRLFVHHQLMKKVEGWRLAFVRVYTSSCYLKSFPNLWAKRSQKTFYCNNLIILWTSSLVFHCLPSPMLVPMSMGCATRCNCWFQQNREKATRASVKVLGNCCMLLGEHNNAIVDNVTLNYFTQSTILTSWYHVNFHLCTKFQL